MDTRDVSRVLNLNLICNSENKGQRVTKRTLRNKNSVVETF